MGAPTVPVSCCKRSLLAQCCLPVQAAGGLSKDVKVAFTTEVSPALKLGATSANTGGPLANATNAPPTAAGAGQAAAPCDFYYMAPTRALPPGGAASTMAASADMSYRIALYTSPVPNGGTSGRVLVRLRGPRAGDPNGAPITTRTMPVNETTPLTP